MSAKRKVHPARETLAAFGSGKLQPADAVVVEAHIAECDECCETLHGLGSDTFVDLVRESNALQLDSFADDGTIGLHDAKNETVCDPPVELANHPRYRVLELLGKGGMGNVYKAEHTLMNRSVALKVINRALVQSNQAVERFRREVQSAAQLSHPNIVTAYDAEQAGDVHYLVMEYVPGDNLSDVVKREGPLDVAQASDYIWQVANGLQHAYEEGLVHRDIKPHNLMVTSSGRIKILDFGLATLAAEALPSGEKNLREDSDHRGSPNLTSAGSMMGTPDFISPEQASDARFADIRSDIYSLGCTLYYLLTGRPPFTKGSAMEKVKAHAEAEPEPIENVCRDIPKELSGIVRRMMAKDPANRFQTPAEAADAITPFVAPHRTTPISKHEADSAASTGSSRRSWWPPTFVQSLACAAFAFVLAGVIYIATDNGTLEVVSDDENVEIIVRGGDGLRIVDTVTGSTAKRLRSGEYSVDLKGNGNDFELNKDRFVLKRGGNVIVRVTRRNNNEGLGTSPTVSKIWEDPKDVFGAPSPDGRYLSFTDWETGDLAVRDLRTGENRRLTNKGPWSESKDFAYKHIWSPDGRQIVTSWFRAEDQQYDLRIIELDGSEQTKPNVVYFDKEHYVTPKSWSATTQQILFTRAQPDKTSQLALVSAVDKSVSGLKSLGWGDLKGASISPDGRYVVYDFSPLKGDGEHDILILNADGSDEVALVDQPGQDYAPIWTADGKRIVFTSDRNGSPSLWVLSVDNGRPSGPAVPVPSDMNRMLSMGLTQNGTYFYANENRRGGDNIYVTELDPTSNQFAAPTKIAQRNSGFNSRPAWSADGEQLAYVSNRGPFGDSSSLIIRSMKSGQERTLLPRLDSLVFQNSRPLWAPDGNSILLSGGHDGRWRWGIFAVDTKTADVSALTGLTTEGLQRAESAVWSADGKTVYFIRRSGEEEVTIFASDLKTDEEMSLYGSDGPESSGARPAKKVHSLAVSSDGQWLAFAGRNSICVMPSSGGKPRVVCHAPAEEEILSAVGLVWTPDGNSLIYGSAPPRGNASSFEPHKNTRLWQVPVAGGSAREAGLAMDGLSHISLHPDGRQLVFTAPATGEVATLHGIWALDNFLPPLEKDLANIPPATAPNRSGTTVRRVWSHPVFGGAPSPDGRYVSHPMRSDLAVRDLITGTSRRLTKNTESGEFAYIQAWSPNGKEIVTSWWLPDEHQFDLRIVPLEDGSPRTIYFNKDHYVHPYAWSKSGDILASRVGPDKVTQLLLISATDGKVRLLKSLGWNWGNSATISPDGRHVVYDMPQEDDSSKLDIFILSTEEGGTEERLVEHPDHDHSPFWASDGRRVVFTSDRSGSENLWVLPVENGRPDGFPHSVNIDMTRANPRGITKDGTYFYSDFSSGRSDVFVANFDTKKRVISGIPSKIAQRYEGFNSKPAWSQDGRYLAFVSDGTQKDGLVIKSVENNEQRVLNASQEFGFFYNGRPRWSPDGKQILSSEGRDEKGRWGIQAIDAELGTVTSLVPPTNDDKDRHSSAAWSPDGKGVYYIRNAYQKTTFASKVAGSTLGTNGERILHKSIGSRRSGEYYPAKLYFSLAVSPDGEKIGLATKNTISVMSSSGGEPRIVHHVQQGRIPEAVGILWTHDSGSIIFGTATSQQRAGGRLAQANTRLWEVSIEDGSASEIGLVADNLSHIAMHPDGNQIAYTAAASGVSAEQQGVTGRLKQGHQ